MFISYKGFIVPFSNIESGIFGNVNCIVYSTNKKNPLALYFKTEDSRSEFINRFVKSLRSQLPVIKIDSLLDGLEYDEVLNELELNKSSLLYNLGIKRIYVRGLDKISYLGDTKTLFDLEVINNEVKLYTNGLLNLIKLKNVDSDSWENLKTDILYKAVNTDVIVIDLTSKFFKDFCIYSYSQDVNVILK